MGRFAFGVGLLLAMLCLGLVVMFAMDRVNQPVSQLLEDAAQAALAGDLEQGVRLAEQARKTWDNRWHTVASLADHSPMDEIDSLFAQMETYAQAGLTGEFAACCNRLSQLVQAVAEAHSLHWWNLF